MTALFFFLLFALGSAEGGEWRVVHDDRSVSAFSTSYLSLDQSQTSQVKHVWCWSPGSAPVKLESAEEWTVGCPVLTSQKLPVTSATAPRPLSLIAAPIEMWQEIPENLLPLWELRNDVPLSLPFSAETPWRARVFAQGLGTWWLDIPPRTRHLDVSPTTANDLALEVVDADGSMVERGWLQIYPDPVSSDAHVALLEIRHGSAQIRGLPFDKRAVGVISAKGRPTKRVWLQSGRGVTRVRLDDGTTVRVRFIAEDGRPIPDVEGVFETWISDRPRLTSRGKCRSDSLGHCVADSLPVGRTVLRAKKNGLATFMKEFEVASEGELLGDVILGPARALEVVATDELGYPLSEVELRTQPSVGPSVQTDREGRATILDLPREGLLRLLARKEGYLTAEYPLPLPASDLRIALRSAFMLEGRVISASFEGLEGLKLRLQAGGKIQFAATAQDGSFRVGLEPGIEFVLSVKSASSSELIVRLAPGAAGEVRNLGDLMLDEGLAIVGRIVDSETDDGIQGATIKSDRPGRPMAVAGSPLADDLIARSGSDGFFRLTGLQGQTAGLSVQAPGYARRELSAVLTFGQSETDIGPVEMRRGATVQLTIEAEDRAEADLEARLDLAGKWRSVDMLRAVVQDGMAVFHHVPPGRALATVFDGREMVCEVTIEVAATSQETAALCRQRRLRVFGRVALNGEPVRGGLLEWLPPAPDDPALIIVTSSDLGLEQRTTYGAGRPGISSSVGSDGFYSSEALSPGSWIVSWSDGHGTTTEPKQVELPPEISELELSFRFDGGMLRGRVSDQDGKPVAGALVREARTGMSTLSKEDGSFVFTGLAPGQYILEASLRELSSQAKSVEIGNGQDWKGKTVDLILGREKQEERINFRVVDREGRALPGSFVVVEDDLLRQWIVTTDVSGKADFTLEQPWSSRLRAAAVARGQFALGGFVSLSDVLGTEMVISVSDTGGIVLQTDQRQDAVSIRSEGGWEIAAVLRRLGRPVVLHPDEPTLVVGLPSGTYEVNVGGKVSMVQVRPGESARLDLQ